ncbi:bifunctional hydroxymethylpyrimidine kinase/phosphomethylpyrimidine kinase [Acetobacter thailandicus]|nr:bifunctional hydroxymethylpyrimidine kinase/phosphomethylpyrimidine kinase [Acetobacter thailandicus]
MQKTEQPVVRVLSIAGSDSGGGAGIQADIKTITTLQGYAMTAITALTAQNTHGVDSILPVPPEFLRQQIHAVLNDLGTDAFKTGMVGGAAEIRVVAEEIQHYVSRFPDVPVVVDPVMVAKGGAALLAEEVLDTLQNVLLPQATVITPNIPEAICLVKQDITTVNEMRQAARRLYNATGAAVVVKGGHLTDDTLVDVLFDGVNFSEFSDTRINTRHTHGTGCTLASALATRLAQGYSLFDAVHQARAYVRQAIVMAPGLGGGAGPLWHQVAFMR